MHPPTQLSFLFDWFISLISPCQFLPDVISTEMGQSWGVPSPLTWSSGTRFYLGKGYPYFCIFTKPYREFIRVSTWRKYKPTMFNILPSVLWPGNEATTMQDGSISVGGEFWNTWDYCQITTWDRSIHSSIIQHRDKTLGCTIYLTLVAKAQTMCSNTNIEITPPKKLCQKNPALPYW